MSSSVLSPKPPTSATTVEISSFFSSFSSSLLSNTFLIASRASISTFLSSLDIDALRNSRLRRGQVILTIWNSSCRRCSRRRNSSCLRYSLRRRSLRGQVRLARFAFLTIWYASVLILKLPLLLVLIFVLIYLFLPYSQQMSYSQSLIFHFRPDYNNSSAYIPQFLPCNIR